MKSGGVITQRSVLSFLVLYPLIFVLALSSSSAFALSNYEIVMAFDQAGVKPLASTPLHSDTENTQLVKLGKNLFFDKILSGNKNISCATCHFPSLGTSDTLPVPVGTGGTGRGRSRSLSHGNFIPRNSPAVFNMGQESFHTAMLGRKNFN